MSGAGGPAVPAKCLKCGWLGRRGIDQVDPRVAALWETTGTEAPILNRCRECREGECVDIEGPFELEGAVSAHVQREIAALMPGADIKTMAVMREREGRLGLCARLPGRPWVEREVTAAQVDSPRFKQILERVAASMHREIVEQPASDGTGPTAPPPRNVAAIPWSPGRALRRFNHINDNDQPAPPAPNPEEP